MKRTTSAWQAGMILGTTALVLLAGPLAAAPRDTASASGSITGMVTDAGSGEPVSGAVVSIDGGARVTSTGSDGRYRLTGIAAGSHVLVVRRIRYARASHDAIVREGEATEVDFALVPTANVLDQIVVTGTVAPTERRAIPTPITVVGAAEMEEQNIQRVDQIFRGLVPGSIAWQEPGYDYQTTINSRGASSLYNNTAKTYVDGIEIADPSFIASIDPNSIDHIEFTRGPQASTIYGSDADGGVLQIFTKKGRVGAARPEIDAKVTFGAVQSGYRGGATLRQDHAVSVSGGGESFSYDVGGSYQHLGEFVPDYHSSSMSGFGAAAMEQGAFSASFTARYHRREWGRPRLPQLWGYTRFSKPWNRSDDQRNSTYGVRLGFAATPHWHHSLTLGQDETLYEYFNTAARYTTPADSLRELFSSRETKSSVAYNTTVDLSFGRALSSTLTAGVDHYRSQLVFLYSPALRSAEGSLAGLIGQRAPWSNTGYFAQLQADLHEALFITAGLRAEQNDNFGADYGLAYSPRLGASYVRSVAGATIKVRASYGDAIRPPLGGQKAEYRTSGYVQLANQNLGPERQSGWDGGVDLFFGDRASLSITRYDQTAKDLIDLVFIPDSTSDLTYQNQNVGEIRNRGWELEGRVRTRHVDFTATYSLVSSRIARLAPHYSGDYQLGDRVLAIPSASGGITVAYRPIRRTTITGNLVYIGSWTNRDLLALYGFYYGGDAYRGSGRAYWSRYAAVTKFNLGVAQEFTRNFTGFVRVENVADVHAFESDNSNPPTGRTTLFGARLRY